MKFDIKYQEEYSRGELLLRTFLGAIYLIIPHMLCLMVFGLWSGILRFITFWIILFTGKFPESFFNYQVIFFKWALRVQSRLLNLAEGYPAFGMDATDDSTELEIRYNENYNQGLVLLVWLLGGVILFPHFIALFVLIIGMYFVIIIAWFAVLFTGKYPKNMHVFMVNTQRWMFRLMIYLHFMNPNYPPFSGKPDEELGLNNNNDVIDA